MLAQALYGLDRLDDAEAEAARGAQLGASDDVLTQMFWRQVKAKVLARRGAHPDAERLGREAVALSEPTDVLVWKGDAWADLAEVLELGGKPDQAAAALEQALALYERKGSVASIERARVKARAPLGDAGGFHADPTTNAALGGSPSSSGTGGA